MIVHKFKGVIDFISDYKKGSTFFFTFQIEDFDQEEFKANDIEEEKASSRSMRIFNASNH